LLGLSAMPCEVRAEGSYKLNAERSFSASDKRGCDTKIAVMILSKYSRACQMVVLKEL